MAAPRSKVLREVEVLARLHTKTAIDTLVAVCGMWESHPAPAVTAASAILDRGWGKPQQNITIENTVEHLSDDDLARHIDERVARIITQVSSGGSGSCRADPGEAPPSSQEIVPRLVH